MDPAADISAKLRLLIQRENQVAALQRELHGQRAWMSRTQRITEAMATAAHPLEALTVLANEVVADSPYEFVRIATQQGIVVSAGEGLGPHDEDVVERVMERWWSASEPVGVVQEPAQGLRPSHETAQGSKARWLLGGSIAGFDTGETYAVMVVGRSERTAGYYRPPWDLDIDQIGYLLATARYVLAAVSARVSLEARVEDATTRLREALDESRAANRAKSHFLANMSHELRTPLNAILGYAELAALEAEDAGLLSVQRDLGRVGDAGQLLLRIISDILDISKIESGRIELTLTTFDLIDLVRGMVSTSEPLAAAGSNRLSLCVPDEPIVVVSDDTKLRQIVMNLTSNACKFTQEGSITVEVAVGADGPTVRVEDTGAGMPPEVLERIFEPFYQAREAHSGPAGTGLGLAISQRLCGRLGGGISASSEVGRGSSFVVTLPWVAPEP